MATLQLNVGLSISCAVLFIPSSTLLLGMRYYARRQQKAPLGADDWLMVPAYVLLVGMQVSFLVSICLRELGYASFPGEDAQDSDSIANRPFYPFLLMEVPELALVKLSMLFFYRRVFNTGGTPYINWATIVMLGIVSAWAVAYFFTFLFLCGGHPSNYWVSPVAEKAYCVKTQEVHLSFSISDMILDIFVLLLAFPAILRLQMSIGRRIAVLGIFLLGAITLAASVTRMVVFISATALRYDPNLNFEYLITSSMYWSMLECGLGFIGANLVLVYGLIISSALSRGIVRGFRSILSRLPSGISRHSGSSNPQPYSTPGDQQAFKMHTTSSAGAGAASFDDVERMIAPNHVRIEHEFDAVSTEA